jgi:hypothetical protein
MLAQHVRIFLIHHIEKFWWTHERNGHEIDGSGGDKTEASKWRRVIGKSCRMVGKFAFGKNYIYYDETLSTAK